VTPDGGTLIVAETTSSRPSAPAIGVDRTLSNRRTYADLLGRAQDGIELDAVRYFKELIEFPAVHRAISRAIHWTRS
jgi:hypothetical protein